MASWSQSSLYCAPAWPFVHSKERAWEVRKASIPFQRSWFRTGVPLVVIQPFLFQLFSHLWVMALWRYLLCRR